MPFCVNFRSIENEDELCASGAWEIHGREARGSMIRSKQFGVVSSVLAAGGLLAVMLLSSLPSWAQVTGATLSGTVTDPSGALVPQAGISIKNLATGISTSVSTNADALYSAPNLLPGNYEVTVSASGFKTEVRSGINLTVGAQQVLNVALQVGQATQQVEVAGEVTSVELASSSISSVVGSNTVVDLPLNGRDWTALAALQPGVSALVNQQPGGVSASRANRGFGNQMTISGTRPQLNNYRVDGISAVDYAGGSPGGVIGVTLGVDAIAEFSVLTSNSSAEYGKTSGGVINAITRSGTNQLHGDAYWFLRDEDFDARQFFDATLPPFHRNQFGGSAGGPIQKDKTFFFADYEGFRQDLSTTRVDNVPSADARNGILHNADGSTTVLTVHPLVEPFLGFWPLPNAGLTGLGNTGHFDVATSAASNEDFVTTRIDRRISEKDSISGTWYLDKSQVSSPEALNNEVLANRGFRELIALEETHIFSPALVNSVRGGYNRVTATPNESILALNPLIADPSLFSFAGRFAPQIQVTGLTTFSGGLGELSSTSHRYNSFQGYDDAFLTKGSHSLKFGFAFERMQHWQLSRTRQDGSFKFGTLEAFLSNEPKSFEGTPPGSIAPYENLQSLFGGYVQDDWRWRPNLTVNLGLRYEMVTVPTEVHNRLTNVRNLTDPLPHLGSPYFNNATYRNFEPRVGFSWDPSHNGKTAVRGAFGIFDALPLNYEFQDPESGSAPFSQDLTGSGLAAGSFPTGAPATLLAIGNPISTQQVASIEFNPPRNYVMIWNLNVQRQLTPSLTAMIGYVGNRGVHMLFRDDDANMVLPTAAPQGYLWPSPAGSGTVLNPNLSDIRFVDFGGDSNFNALELQVTKRMTHGFQAQGSYTWQKNIDTGSSSILGDTYLNSISSLLWFCNSCRRGLSDYNVAQNLTVNYIWDVPTPKSWGAIGSHVLGGWELGGILTAESGIPVTPLMGGDPLGLNSNDPFAYPDRLNTSGCASVVNPGNPNNYVKLNCFAAPNPLTLLGNAGRNTIVGPGLVTFDFSLFKNNYIKKISENFNVQFRAEFFNVFNRANFATPVANSTLFDETGAPVDGAGAIDATSTTARQIQFALKLIW